MPAESASDSAGRRRTAPITAPQNRSSPGRLPKIGIRPLSTLSPSRCSSAGSTVSEPMTAVKTTIIVPIPIVVKIALPANSIPAIAIRTVAPEMRTAWPEVAAVRRRAACEGRPARRSSRSRWR